MSKATNCFDCKYCQFGIGVTHQGTRCTHSNAPNMPTGELMSVANNSVNRNKKCPIGTGEGNAWNVMRELEAKERAKPAPKRKGQGSSTEIDILRDRMKEDGLYEKDERSSLKHTFLSPLVFIAQYRNVVRKPVLFPSTVSKSQALEILTNGCCGD